MHAMHSTLIRLSYFQMALTVLLAIVPYISATPSPFRKGLDCRGPAIQQCHVPPSEWTLLGCYTDNPAQRTLTSAWFTDPVNMTAENCIKFCQKQALDSIFAGVENGTDCFCGSVLTSGAVEASSLNCISNCVGNPAEPCGGRDYLTLYWNGEPLPPPMTFVPSVGNWILLGCYNDSAKRRTLTKQVSVQGGPYNNTVENCVNSCQSAGYNWAGVEFAQQCWCDKGIMNNDPIDAKNCLLACSGDSTENCGGADALVLYGYQAG
ncbi:WSC domain-containing protein [Lactarius quietus]|nr:WSC domain-containing protein [Lactarius quietus]